jgi:uncharacterized repeat protein (TIGR01451 family)
MTAIRTTHRLRIANRLAVCAFALLFGAHAHAASSSPSFVLQPSVTAGGGTASSANQMLAACIDPAGGGAASSATQALTIGCGALMQISAPIVVPAAADLSIFKTTTTPAVFTGGTIHYSMIVTNNGPDAATNVIVTDVLPASTSLQSATPTQGSCTGTTTVTCILGSLANGASATIDLFLTANSSGTVANSASVSATESDAATANNSSAAPAVAVGDPAAVPLSPAALAVLALLLAALALRRQV